MSRIGMMPVTVPAGVQVEIKGSDVNIKGPKGVMGRSFSPTLKIKLDNDQVIVERTSELANVRALHGTTRALIQNMVTGVSTGFTKVLEIDGVGYRAEMNGDKLVLYLGFSHPIELTPPDGITYDVDVKARQIKVMGQDPEHYRSDFCRYPQDPSS